MCEISVVLPVFNGVLTIARAVHSILEQTHRELELIVVDDGSTDGTADVVRSIADPRLKLASCSHRGVALAANTGTELASAPLIARMDADDFAHPMRIEKQLALLQSEKLDVVGCQIQIVDESDHAVKSMRRYERWINEETCDSERISALRFVELPLVNPTILARRSYFELSFGDNELPEDYDLMLRAAAAGMRFGKVAEVLLDWADRPERLTRNDSRYSREAFMRCRQKHLLAGPLSGVNTVDLWGVGQTGKPWLRWLQSQGIDVRWGYDVSQRKLNQTIHGVPIRHPEEMPIADGTLLVIAVGAAGARELIVPHLLSRDYVIGKDAWFVA